MSDRLAGRPSPGEATVLLLQRIRAGDSRATEQLFARYLPRLQRWASGRLPPWARDVADTHDLVQETLLQTFRLVQRFEYRRDLAFQAYLRQAVRNRICEELRKSARRPVIDPLDETSADSAASPLEAAIGTEAAERYERALARLRHADRELIVARVEMGCSYDEIAAAAGKPTVLAARKACERALLRLAEEMKVERRRHVAKA